MTPPPRQRCRFYIHHLCCPGVSPVMLNASRLTFFLHVISDSNRGSYCCHQQWHWGGQGQAGASRSSQIERRQFLHWHAQDEFSHVPHYSVNVTDYYKWSLTAGYDCRMSQTQTHQSNMEVDVILEMCLMSPWLNTDIFRNHPSSFFIVFFFHLSMFKELLYLPVWVSFRNEISESMMFICIYLHRIASSKSISV